MWSGLVRLLKISLPLAALALVVAVFVAPRDQVEFDFGDFDLDFEDGLRLEEPRFSGADASGRPFTIIADWALPDSPDPERIDLGPVRGEAALADGGGLRLAAGGGVILPKARRLVLDQVVSIETTDGWRLAAPRAEADLEGRTVETDGPVSGEGPGAEIAAGAMRAARRAEGDYIWFEDGVRLRIDPAAASDANEAE